MMGCFATGIAVVTTRDSKLGIVGLTINSLTSVSLDPPLVLFCLDKSAAVYPVFKKANTFAINFLSDDQENVSRYFADRHHHARPKNLWDSSRRSSPILKGTLGWIECAPHSFYKGGDHTIIVGRVTALRRKAGANEPLVYYHGRYRDLAAAKLTSGARK